LAIFEVNLIRYLLEQELEEFFGKNGGLEVGERLGRHKFR
jgi:hypothetical protein